MAADRPLQIAIDGPVAAGKGDIAARLAKEFGLTYIYTGAMYRMLALACIRQTTPLKDEAKVLAVLSDITMDLTPPQAGQHDRVTTALLNDDDVTDRIMAPDTAQGASDVATLPQVRKLMVKRQQDMAGGRAVVMEGRDIGLRVLPKAQLKIYLTASVEERARRRMEQWKTKGIVKSLDEVLTDTKIRDEQDMSRATDPLVKLPDAWELDTTGMDQDRVVDTIREELVRRQLL
jgi:cytidylate kinase